MIRSPPRCTRTGRLCPSPALSRSYAEQKVPAPHVFARRSGEVRCVAEPPFIFDANIGCEFANELVAEPKACFDRRQAGPNSDFRDILSGQVELRSEEHTSELQSLMRIPHAVFCLKNTNTHYP